MGHTRTPWRFTGVKKDMHGQTCTTGLVSKDAGMVAKGGECQWTGLIVFDREEDMEFFLKAVNNYDPLVKAASSVVDQVADIIKTRKQWDMPITRDRILKLIVALKAAGEKV